MGISLRFRSSAGTWETQSYSFFLSKNIVIASAMAVDILNILTLPNCSHRINEARIATNEFFCSGIQPIVDEKRARAEWEYPLIKQDATLVPNDNGVVDAFLLPPTAALNEIDPSNLIFLFSTAEFQRARLQEDTWFRKYTDDTDDPGLAAHNFIESGVVTAQNLLDECRCIGAHI